MRVTLLCGGVGGSKMALGLYREFPQCDLTVVVNTADDLQLHGLYICPDLDTVTYTLSNLVNRETGWGMADDTFGTMDMLARLGGEAWFRLGDRDLATHLFRTNLLSAGLSLTDVTNQIRRSLGVRCSILPMSDNRVTTQIRIKEGWIPFQEYFVKRRYADEPLEVRYAGLPQAAATPEVVSVLRNSDVIVVAPSNPVVSIRPILSLSAISEALRESEASIIAVSPLVRSSSVTGPADALMRAVGYTSTAAGVADIYQPWLRTLVIHNEDEGDRDTIERSGVMVRATDTLMPDLAAKRRLARYVIENA